MTTVLIVLAAAAAMIAVEVRSPGRRWPEVAGWWTRASLLNSAQVAVVVLLNPVWDPWMAANRPWSADSLGPIGGALAGYFALTFVYYWWHRWRHESDLLWRWLHQVHHSAQRIEVITSFYKHPLEIAANGVLSSAVLFLGLGLGVEAASGAVLLSGLAELFYHWNVTTPVWLGYFFQRPESHRLHHQESVHHYNFSDLPLWDMLFGTFKNPDTWEASCGLGVQNEARLYEMLLAVDVLKPEPARRNRRVAWALLLLGLAQMFGSGVGLKALQGVAAASAASPAPKVFTAVKGFEAFSTRFALEWESGGVPHRLELDADRYQRLKGPYNRRNAYGAALAAGPILPSDLRDPVAEHALCGDAPVLRELGIDPAAIDGAVRVVYSPTAETAWGVPLTVEVLCP